MADAVEHCDARNLFLPALALAVPVAGSLTRVVRTSMVEGIAGMTP